MAHIPDPMPVVDELVRGVEQVLGEQLVGAYLQGSYALGDFDAHSDVDFVIALDGAVSPQAEPKLQQLHAHIYELDDHWARHLEGSYIPADILPRPSPDHPELLFLDHGAQELVRSDHCNTYVVRWILREHGVTLVGPPPRDLIDPIPDEGLRKEALERMRAWAEELRQRPSMLDNQWSQPYTVISYCRMLYTLEKAAITSKPAAARWAKLCLGGGWHGLIDDALARHPDPFRRVEMPSDPVDRRRTLDFVEHVMRVGEDA